MASKQVLRPLLALLATVLLGSCVGGNGSGAASKAGRVLILGMDGTRSELLELAHMPNLARLSASGFSDLDAITGDVSLSGPGWSSMLTGVWCDKHNVIDNDVSWANSQFNVYPHFMARVEQLRPELKTFSVSHWEPINEEILCADERADNCGRVDKVVSKSTDAGVRDAVVDILNFDNPDAVFVQFDDIDHAGHGTAPYMTTAGGFCPKAAGSRDGACTVSGMNSEYIRAGEVTDGYIGDILTALYRRPNYKDENWLVIVSPDHGGAGTLQNQHGFNTAQERRTFFIVSGPPASPLPGTPVSSLAGLPNAANNGSPPTDTTGVKIVDVAATALFHLRIPIDPKWGLEGQPVGLPGVPAYVEKTIPSCMNPASFAPDNRQPEDGNNGTPAP